MLAWNAYPATSYSCSSSLEPQLHSYFYHTAFLSTSIPIDPLWGILEFKKILTL